MSPLKRIHHHCQRLGLSLATAESCTGGALSAHLVSQAGASAVVRGGIVAYCDALKHQLLGVPQALLDEHTAVSEPVALAMSRGARARTEADIAISTTGYLSPITIEGEAICGRVYLGITSARGERVLDLQLSGTRAEMAQEVVQQALNLLINHIETHYP